ncbi:MAG: hypothetical protein EXR39_18075 [Betaproteobacteria bacterium]|nr:hypothetical protein [Betaproteobacteria bacterium]
MLLAIALSALSATPAQAQAARDIDYLLTRIEQSSCQFVRNSKVHPPSEAALHLRNKRAAASRELTPEQFIETIASKSSMSGEPYLIRCKGQADEQSGVWLRRALKERTG